MEVAINSLLIFIILVFPGIIFRRFYYVGEFSKQFNSANWLNSFYISIIPGLIIQIITFSFFFSFIFEISNESPIECFVNNFFLSLQNNSIPDYFYSLFFLKYLGLYFLLLIFFSAIIAQICWVMVRQLNLDIKFKPLRFRNYWHYYFSGEIIKTKSFKSLHDNNKGSKVILTEADVLVDFGNGENKLYKGLITQYTICKDTGDLKNVYLTEARRYKKLEGGGVTLVDIPGDIMILPFDKIININLKYIFYKKSNNISKVISSLLILISLIVLMVNPFEVFLKDVNLWGNIIGRVYLFLIWVFFVQFFHNLYLLYDVKKDIKIKGKNSSLLKRKDDVKNVLKGSLIFNAILIFIIWKFFM